MQTFVSSQNTAGTIVDHYSKFLQKKVDVGLIFGFSSLAKQNHHISSSIHVVF